MGRTPYDVVFYTNMDGGCPVMDFLDGIGAKPRAKILRFIEYLQSHGPDLPRPYADVLVGKIREPRVPYGRLQWRALYFFAGRRVVLTSGFLKKTAAVPEREIQRAARRMRDWLVRGGV